MAREERLAIVKRERGALRRRRRFNAGKQVQRTQDRVQPAVNVRLHAPERGQAVRGERPLCVPEIVGTKHKVVEQVHRARQLGRRQVAEHSIGDAIDSVEFLGDRMELDNGVGQ